MPKRNQLQLNILQLYKEFVRLSKIKPGLLFRVRDEFKRDLNISQKENLITIENSVRRAQYQLDMLKKQNVVSVKQITLKPRKD